MQRSTFTDTQVSLVEVIYLAYRPFASLSCARLDGLSNLHLEARVLLVSDILERVADIRTALRGLSPGKGRASFTPVRNREAFMKPVRYAASSTATLTDVYSPLSIVDMDRWPKFCGPTSVAEVLRAFVCLHDFGIGKKAEAAVNLPH